MANKFISLIAHLEMAIKPDERWLNVINISCAHNCRNRVRWIELVVKAHYMKYSNLW